MRIKSYSETIRFSKFEERYDYLRIGGTLGMATFGSSRYLNQTFYTSRLWQSIRNEVIVRDNGCDLGIPGREIYDKIIIHHINPITEDDIEEMSEFLLNPEFLICTCFDTHNAIHFGDASLLPKEPVERFPNDTCPWLL